MSDQNETKQSPTGATDGNKPPAAPSGASGIRAPSKIAKPSSLPLKKTSSIFGSSSSLASSVVNTGPDSSEVLTVNTDDFIIGDRVFVNGTKPGYIQYIGETQFAPGEWAGVVLDDAVGKNDGSVAGVRYFQCEAKRGVFARLHRITRLPTATNGSSTPNNSMVRSMTSRPSSVTSPAGSVKGTPASVRTTTSTTTTTTLSPAIKVGDRVIVSSTSGVKMGTLRFLGPTTFAPGNWAGVELDDPVGKNDGSVAGKRYFDCKMKHGLFAPLHKISKIGGGRTSTTTRVSSVTPNNSPLHRRTGSHESLNSSMSSASSAYAGKVRLGVKALTNTQKAIRPVTTSATATTTALQVALKEKEDHIEQLLKERDLERSEVVRAAAQVEEREQKLANLQQSINKIHDEKIKVEANLRDQLESMELEKNELLLLLEDEKKKIEDLQFNIEEESIMKSELENQSEEFKRTISFLQASLKSEEEKIKALSSESDHVKEAEKLINSYKDNVNSLNQKVTQLEDIVKNLESKEFEHTEKMAILESDLMVKDEKVLQLESNMESRKNELSNLQQRLAEMQTELEQNKDRQQKQLEVIDDLHLKINKSDSFSGGLNEAVQNLKLGSLDLERKLKDAEERNEQLSTQKAKLEQQIGELMHTSGDNAQQLVQMNNEIREKEKIADDLKNQLSLKSQDLEKQADVFKLSEEQKATEFKRLNEKFTDEINKLLESLKTKELETERFKTQIKDLNNGIGDLEAKCNDKTAKSVELSKKLTQKESEMLLLNAKIQESSLQLESSSQTSKRLSEQEAKISQLQLDRDAACKKNEEVSKENEALVKEKLKLEDEFKSVKDEKAQKEKVITERETQMVALKEETERLRTTFSQHKTDLEMKLSETELVTKTMNEIRGQYESERIAMNEVQSKLQKAEEDKINLKQQIVSLQLIVNEKNQLDSSHKKVQEELEELKQRKESEIKCLENEKTAAEKLLTSTQKQLEERNSELDNQKAAIAQLKNKNNEDSLQKYKALNQKLEEDKKHLENKVVELQVSVARTQVNVNNPDSEVATLREEKESLTGQIEFLNSVIVDMQRKNDELNNKVKCLETGDTLDATDLNLNGIKSVVAPRLFCDICDRFDLHDTEDCPTQAGDEPESHSQHRGTRNEDRPYCAACEVFGHWSTECDDNETF